MAMCVRRVVGVMCVTLIVAGVALVGGCGGKADVDIAGNEYMCDEQEFDNRTVEFKPDGTFVYTIVSSRGTGEITGTYEVEGDKLTAVFGDAERVHDLSGQTIEYKILYEGKHIVDPDGVNWFNREEAR